MTLIAFKGTDRIHIFDRHDVQDDLLTQFNAAVFFLKKHLNRRSVIKGMNRVDSYEIPLEALREALVNALIHRDYSIRGTSLTVEVYDDRIEITNPGGIPESLDKKSFGRVSIRRNELIADLFHRMDKGERAGTGIRRMNEAMKVAELPLPEVSSGTFYTITFKRPDFTTTPQVTGEATGQVEAQVKDVSTQSPTQLPTQSDNPLERLLFALKVGECSSGALRQALGIKHRPTFRENYLHPALKQDLIEYTIPEKPTSRLQQYRITEKGRAVLANLSGDKVT